MPHRRHYGGRHWHGGFRRFGGFGGRRYFGYPSFSFPYLYPLYYPFYTPFYDYYGPYGDPLMFKESAPYDSRPESELIDEEKEKLKKELKAKKTALKLIEEKLKQEKRAVNKALGEIEGKKKVNWIALLTLLSALGLYVKVAKR